ncbi:DegV family protein [Thermoflavimicrobium dichotomicum]|uniref:EDD domain protein, DegV family n=1 Tax=Thermoflavimicrobium dichotomicum TaxID=46223 RepID=A0A1I3SRS9_9BACL|nr:DegV family protein [Thermoflavimicrobium dichotomicum]SFJ61564.1 EDD domain protein, DegV family [Thermoflavimicrobium dichotomicum]
MSQVKILTDSTSDIPANLREELNIGVVPLKVHIDGESFLDGVTLHADEFYQKLKQAKELPTTSQPSPHAFCEAFREAAKQGAKQILSIHLSSLLSGTYQSAMLAKEMVAEEGIEVEVMDSKSVSYALGISVVAAARAAKEGKSLEECKAIAERYRKEQELFVLVDTLEFLQKGGRIGKASALVGSLLNIKPILSISDEGEVCPIDKVRGKNKAISRFFELMQKKIAPGTAVSAAMMHADYLEEGEKLFQRVEEMYDVKEKVITSIGPVVGTHAGPKTIAITLVPLHENG